MDLLYKAVATGYSLLYDLRTDPGLDPLRQRDDFKKLMADLEEKTKAHAEAPPAGKVKRQANVQGGVDAQQEEVSAKARAVVK